MWCRKHIRTHGNMASNCLASVQHNFLYAFNCFFFLSFVRWIIHAPTPTTCRRTFSAVFVNKSGFTITDLYLSMKHGGNKRKFFLLQQAFSFSFRRENCKGGEETQEDENLLTAKVLSKIFVTTCDCRWTRRKETRCISKRDSCEFYFNIASEKNSRL